jgi:hypothetical protein
MIALLGGAFLERTIGLQEVRVQGEVKAQVLCLEFTALDIG